ncbi:TSUP family transporter [Nocardioides gilvus]|uniref:TSUP family transporter n=1 Tax=Nocardioides gilvus TaxID=1735589 RepID=UPI000D74A199|nr:TSUP family transporter [Nocardioides gilvus]
MGDLLHEPALGVVVLVAIALGAFAQGATGMGFSLVAAPVLIAAEGHTVGVATVLILAACSSVVPLAREWRHTQPGAVVRLLVPTLLATPLIAWLVHDLDHRVLSVAGGVGVVIGVALLASGLRSHWFRRPEGAIVTGVSSATLNVVGGVGGPPIGLYVANTDWTPAQTRATLHGFLIVQNVVTAVVIGLVWPDWRHLAALVVGSVIGIVVAPRLSVVTARSGILALSAIGGVALVAGSI